MSVCGIFRNYFFNIFLKNIIKNHQKNHTSINTLFVNPILISFSIFFKNYYFITDKLDKPESDDRDFAALPEYLLNLVFMTYYEWKLIFLSINQSNL